MIIKNHLFSTSPSNAVKHPALYVNDLEKAKDFFVNFLNGKANTGYHNPKTNFRSYFISFDDGARTTGDGYYESCIVGLEDNLIELTE